MEYMWLRTWTNEQYYRLILQELCLLVTQYNKFLLSQAIATRRTCTQVG